MASGDPTELVDVLVEPKIIQNVSEIGVKPRTPCNRIVFSPMYFHYYVITLPTTCYELFDKRATAFFYVRAYMNGSPNSVDGAEEEGIVHRPTSIVKK